jgi:4-methyl-5(b-hydroxyethyl)-thiazole monophosphate biosynthesis
MSSTLVIIMDGVEELEATAPIDLLRRAEVEVTVATAGNSLQVVGRNGIHIEGDRLLSEVAGNSFDLIVIPGGPGHATLLENSDVLKRLAEQHARAGLIGSICAGPVVLKKAGVLDGRRYTSFPGTSDLLPDRDPASPVVVDGHLITSQGAGTAILFALALVEALCGKAKRQEVAASICHPD